MSSSPEISFGGVDQRREGAFEVERTGLLSVLAEGSRRRMSLILGPSGSGKSVLVRQWIRRLPSGCVARVAVDPDANDAESFGRDLVRAVSEVRPGFGGDVLRHLALSGERLGRPFLEAFVDATIDLGSFTVVVDDLHELPCLVAEELGWLIIRTPPDFHLVVATRSEPPMRLARLRAHDQLTEIRASSLALDVVETAKLAEHVSGRRLTVTQRQLLHDRTEGWAVGVQLAALALRSRPDGDEYLRTFSGANRAVADYLIEEVVRQQPAEVRSFLWSTSVLDRLDPDLCDELTGRDDAHEVLTELQRRELFVVPLESHPGSFRYHQLFAEVMRHQLRAQDRALHDDLLVRTARWHLGRGELASGVECLLRAERWHEALDIVGANGWTLYERGETAQAIKWLESVPPAEMRRHGQARFTLVTLYRFAGRPDAATGLLDELRREVEPGSRAAMAVDVLFATGVRQDVAPEVALVGAQAAVDWFDSADRTPSSNPRGPSDDWVLSCTRVYGAVALTRLGRLNEAREWLSAALQVAAPHRPWKVRALGCLALVEAEEGNLEKAYALAQQAFKLDAEANGVDPISVIDARLASGVVAYDRGDLRAAAEDFGEAERMARVACAANTLPLAVVWQARVSLALGEPRTGLERLVRWRREGNPQAPLHLQPLLAAVESALLMAMREPERAKRVLGRAPHTTDTLAVAAQFAATQGDRGTLAIVVERWPAAPSRRSRIQHLVWRAVLSSSRGDEVATREHLRAAVRLADVEGHSRVFLDAGPLVTDLLRSSGALADASSLEELNLALMRMAAERSQAEGLLSDRELEVVTQLDTLLSNQEIAEKLLISHNTLKTHIRRIYRKLGAESRRDAVARAQGMGLLPHRAP